MELSGEVVRYYARYVGRTQVFRMRQQAGKKYLMVLSASSSTSTTKGRPIDENRVAGRTDAPQRGPSGDPEARLEPATGHGCTVAGTSASKQKAAYLADGILHNDVVESTIHSTDTHASPSTRP
jgi:hypothetical protein